MIDIAIRFHDTSAISDPTLERRLLARVGRHGMRASFAVVPHAGGGALRADDGRPEAARAGTVEIAEPWIPPRIQSLFPTHCLMLQPLFLSPRRKEAQT
ncbi:MAG: hypothetical protein K6T56_07595 [Burkholderiales bacterium]|nr:hypothetical protein [Burkholderiales bacterium]